MKSFQLLLSTGLIITGSAILYSCGGVEKKPTSTSQEKPVLDAPPPDNKTPETTPSLYAKGEEVYKQTCQACHQANGEGLPNAFPPLAKSDYLIADKTRAIKQILKGSSEEIVVNGQKFNGTMPPQSLTDEQVADVLNYALNSWGNNGGTVTIDEVKLQRGN